MRSTADEGEGWSERRRVADNYGKQCSSLIVKEQDVQSQQFGCEQQKQILNIVAV